jgi:Tol biopolymer transport system component
MALAALTALVALAIPAIRHLREQPPPPPAAVRLSLSVPAGADPGWSDETLDAAISPDDAEIVFVATRDGVRELWRRGLDEERAELVRGTGGAQWPAWKQTGNVISFFADGRLKQVTLADGVVHNLTDAPSAAGATWLRDGSLLFANGSAGPLQRLREGRVEDATTLAAGDIAHAFPVAVGTTDDFVYVAIREDGRRMVRLAANGAQRDVAPSSGHAAIVGEYLLLTRDGALLAYERDRETGALAAHAVAVAVDVGVSASGRSLFTASSGLLLHAPAARRAHLLAWLDASGSRGKTVGDGGDYWQVRLSPDDRFAAVTAMNPLLRALDVMIFPTERPDDVEQLTLALAADTDPVWSPDATRVLFRSMAGGSPDVFVRRAHDRDAVAEPLFRLQLDETPTDWAAGRILFHARGRTGFDIFSTDEQGREQRAVADTSFNETDARWSPDGRWITYVADESGRADIYARELDGPRVRVSFGGGLRPRWTRDGTGIVFIRGSQVMRADRVVGDRSRFAPARVLFDAPGIRDFDVAHRSDRLIALVPAGGDVRPSISAVLNWTSLSAGR